mgnify:FL=1
MMNYFEIKLYQDMVEKFVNVVSQSHGEFTLRSKSRAMTVDPKSILGVLALDLTEELILEHFGLDTIGEVLDFYESIKEFLA